MVQSTRRRQRYQYQNVASSPSALIHSLWHRKQYFAQKFDTLSCSKFFKQNFRCYCSPPTSEKEPSADKKNIVTNDATGKEKVVAPVVKIRQVPSTLIGKWLELSKFRLGSFVIFTTVGGYYLAPDPIDYHVLAAVTIGTSLAVASANAINQYIEVEHDLKMRRTANRVLPSGALSLRHALIFGIITGVLGSSILAFWVNSLSAGLALSNIILYTLVYTPLKRIHPINTWVGSVVGAIPPLIGWAANTGGLEAGAWVLFTILFLWQIPHFLSLSWSLRSDYARAGYKMLSVTHPNKVAPIAFRYCIYMLPMGAFCAAAGITTWTFAFDSVLTQVLVLFYAYQWYKGRQSNDKEYKKEKREWRRFKFHFKKVPQIVLQPPSQSTYLSRKLFVASLQFLPIFFLLMLFHKKERRNVQLIVQ
jgi:protoheme IX farnesyltransferase